MTVESFLPYKLSTRNYQGAKMTTVGFIGLGNMGGPVAGHIQRAGFPMVVFDVRESATQPFRQSGATAVDSAAELAARCDVILTALPMPSDVEQVACGTAGILEGIKDNAIYIDISTNSPALIRQLEPLFAAKGAHILDAPVASGQPGAPRGIHEVMVGGAPDIFARAKPVLSAFGDQVIHAGPLGSGSICKLIHQMINSTISQAI
ncbi:MAG TPA: NAD(P)-dependent oxidoreductase, partial [Candidatus Binatus sp.]|nr:NAD(P)-dependent oxidoreductase [Candidatus Binatus sp.]